MAVAIGISDLVKSFGPLRAVDGVTLEINPGELFFLLGPSGCGKTTLLRSVAGFHQPDSGTITIGTRDVTRLAPWRRDTGMVFQSYALWPHMTVAENVAFGLKVRGVSRSAIQRRVTEALKRVHMAERATAKPNQLSGGQQQRVALARALVIEPQCLLLDEPLSNLDAKLRIEMRGEIRRICKEAGLTAIYVTHDQKEALAIADRLAIMRDGRLEQVGSPRQVYHQPISRFVAGFIGEANFIEGRVVERQQVRLQVETAAGHLETALPATRNVAKGDKVTLSIRPEAIRCIDKPGEANCLSGRLQQITCLGETTQYEVALAVRNDAPPLALKIVELGMTGAGGFTPGMQLNVLFPLEHLVVL